MKLPIAFAVLSLIGCTDSASPEDKQSQADVVEIAGEVTFEENTASRIAGSFTFQDETLTFEARELEPKLLTTTLKLHGMTFDATLDTRDGNRMWSQDAFATDTGEDTAVTEEDQILIFAFVKQIEKANAGISRGDGLAFHFGSVINYWAQWSPAMEVTRVKFEDRERAYDMCAWAKDTNGQWPQGTYPGPTGGGYKWMQYDGHDCSTCSGDPMQGQGLTSCSSIVAYGNWDTPSTTYYLTNGTWSTTANGHGGGTATRIEGQCFGRYGASCGSGTGYFRENGSHDHCVRNGHVLASAWCSDELASTTEPYNCY